MSGIARLARARRLSSDEKTARATSNLASSPPVLDTSLNGLATTLRLTSTCVRVPVENGHFEAVYLEFEKRACLEQVHQLLAQEAGVRLYADGIREGYPTPRFITNPEDGHVARVRVNPQNPRGLWLWAVADNLQVGAAPNALLIAQLAIANRVIGK